MQKWIILLMCVLLCVVCCTAVAETSGDYAYQVLADGTVEITRYTGAAGELDIPVSWLGAPSPASVMERLIIVRA